MIVLTVTAWLIEPQKCNRRKTGSGRWHGDRPAVAGAPHR